MAGGNYERPERLIKRYDNRKLYDTVDRRYVTLEEVARRVSGGEDVRVIDQKTEEDLTHLTLVQIVLEGLRLGTARIPRPLLVQLVRLSTSGFPGGSWPDAQEAAARARDEAERIAGGLLSRGRLSLEEAVALRQEMGRAVHRLVSDAQEGMLGRLQKLLARSPLDGLEGRLNDLETLLVQPARSAKPRSGTRKKPARTAKHA